MLETYQGGTAAFAPADYIKKLRAWCDRHKVLLIFDEVQAAFGRCGKLWGFEHYGVVPDLTTWGKGISSSLPISAVVGRPDVMDLSVPGSASSTHTGNPVCCAAALANLDLILGEDLPGNAARMGAILHDRLEGLQAKFPDHIGVVRGKGLVAGMICVEPGSSNKPDGAFAHEVVWTCVERGLLMFAPVGYMGSTIKICPPLTITEEALLEGCVVLEQALAEVAAKREAAVGRN